MKPASHPLALPGDREELLPLLWQDNYFPLLPGEKREITATFQSAHVPLDKLSVEVDGWNVAPATSVVTTAARPGDLEKGRK